MTPDAVVATGAAERRKRLDRELAALGFDAERLEGDAARCAGVRRSRRIGGSSSRRRPRVSGTRSRRRAPRRWPSTSSGWPGSTSRSRRPGCGTGTGRWEEAAGAAARGPGRRFGRPPERRERGFGAADRGDGRRGARDLLRDDAGAAFTIRAAGGHGLRGSGDRRAGAVDARDRVGVAARRVCGLGVRDDRAVR